MDVKKLCLLAREEIEAFAPGWNERRLFQQIEDIWRFGLFNFVIPMDRRRAIARLATDVLGVPRRWMRASSPLRWSVSLASGAGRLVSFIRS
jgi:hypothetical protein